MSGNLRGIFYMLLFVIVLPVLDALTKLLTEQLEPPQILAVRFAILLLFLTPPAFFLPAREMLAPPARGLLLLRGLLIAGASLFYVAALETVPLATIAAIALLAPLMVTAISPFALGERVGWIRYGAVVLGFAGAVVVLRPTVDGIDEGEALALGAPACFTAYVILTRKMSGQANQVGQLLWTCIGAGAALSLFAVLVWVPLTREAVGLLLLCGVLSLAVYLLQIASFTAGEVSVVMPISYVHIATAASAGYLIWGDVPDPVAWIGMGMIAVSGVIVAIRS